MNISISRPELLNITDEATQQISFGGNQEWYREERPRRAGCGPTTAATILSYLALTQPSLRALYPAASNQRSHFLHLMEEVYEYVTPGNMGLNRTELFAEGVVRFAHDRGISLTPHVFLVQSNMTRKRASVEQLTAFVREGLVADCPIGFLNLAKGRELNLQRWHWITITAAKLGDRSLIAGASDEGLHRTFNLRLWYLSTRLRGGLVYFSQGRDSY